MNSANALTKKVALTSILVMLLWAMCYPLIILSLPFSEPMLTAFFRAAIAGLLLVTIAFVLRRPFPKSWSVWLSIIAIGFTATSVGFWGMFYAAELVSPGLATVLTNTQPLIAGFLGWYFLREHLNRISILSILLGFFGIAIISATSFAAENTSLAKGVLYITIAAFGIAVSNILLKKLANKVDIFYAMGLQLIAGAIPLSFLSYSQNEFQTLQWNIQYTLVLFSLAIFGTALPFILWFWLMAKAPLYKLNIFSFLTPVFGLTIGIIYFSEFLSILQWLGVFIIGVAIYLVTNTENSTTIALKKSNIDKAGRQI